MSGGTNTEIKRLFFFVMNHNSDATIPFLRYSLLRTVIDSDIMIRVLAMCVCVCVWMIILLCHNFRYHNKNRSFQVNNGDGSVNFSLQIHQSFLSLFLASFLHLSGTCNLQ